jgi:hypothetical protein
MKELDKNKANDVALHSFKEFQKLALSFVPGGPIFDAVLNYRSKLKQMRTIAFSESVQIALQNIAGRELHAEDFTTEVFIDIMESVMQKIQSTKSDYKLERFRNILVKNIVSPSENLKTLKFIDILHDINEVQLVILEVMPKGWPAQMDLVFCLRKYGRTKPMENIPHWDVQILIGGNETFVSRTDVDFYLQDLISKGLVEKDVKTVTEIPNLNEISTNSRRAVKVDAKSTTLFSISAVGEEFLKDIRVPSDF